MTFYVNLGYSFATPNKTGIKLTADGSIIPASSMPFHQLVRRRLDKFPHMQNRLFDPQLYLAKLDVNESPKTCAKLASYPWFGVRDLQEYGSSQQQRQWLKDVQAKIHDLWPGKIPSEPDAVNQAVGSCIDFQRHLGCQAIILPSPLTANSNTDYELESFWLESGLNYAESCATDLPVFATIALSDLCLSDPEPLQNRFLEAVLDNVSAREVDGVYFVLEQTSGRPEAKHCSNTRVLWSILHLVHTLSQDAKLKVAVNFLGHFGLVCEAVGADVWAAEWYKSRYRLRIQDKIGGGPAYPSYWSHKAAIDIHVKDEFDILNQVGLIAQIADSTEASRGLLMAASLGQKCKTVPDWQYRPNNVTATREHYLRSTIKAAKSLAVLEGVEKLGFIEHWLQEAAGHSKAVSAALNATPLTSTLHVQSWLDAFRRYRADHNV